MDDRYEKEQEDNKNLERRIEEKEKKTEEYTLAIREAEAQYYKEKDDPVRLEKNNENDEQGIKHLTGQIDEQVKRKAELERERNSQQTKIDATI